MLDSILSLLATTDVPAAANAVSAVASDAANAIATTMATSVRAMRGRRSWVGMA